MFVVLIAHLLAALVGPVLVRVMGRNAFYALATVPAASTIWLATLSPSALAEQPLVATHPWIPQFGISLTLRLDVLSWVLALIAMGIGALVLVYCGRYFKDTEPGLGRFAGVLTAFAGAMVGLVMADDVMVMFTFWELTTIFSYLLIGHYAEKQASRRAAMNALMSTTIGGLAMLVGLLMLAVRAGTLSLAGILADPMWHHGGAYLLVAVLLVIAGAVTKSAQIPTHFWLPGAMAAPTPVSAYLHAAAMVKAGVYLVLRLAPGIEHLPAVSAVLAVLGGATMLLGGWRALRQTDVKLLLAYGTVSQLGFLMAVAGLARPDAVLAAMAMLVAHALFKAPLFMVVGIIDKKFGTRDLRMLSGVGRRAPVIAVIGVVAAASMAAIPPLTGFVAKESIYSALWEAGSWQRGLLVVLVAGSVLTVAYSWRFVTGAFGKAPGAPLVPAVRIPVLFWLPPAVIAVGCLAAPLCAHAVERVLVGYASTLAATGPRIHLTALPHLGVPLALSAVTIGCGVVLCLLARPFGRFQKAVSPQSWRGGSLAHTVDAESGFRRLMRAVDLTAMNLTPLYQRGSLPFTLGIVLVVLMAAALPLLGAPTPDVLVLFHSPIEPFLLIIAAVAAIGAARSRRRLRAVFLITVTGYMTAVYFLLAGAPDVALTQLLVETIMTVVLILVLRRMPTYFSRRPLRSTRWGRWLIAVGTAVAMCAITLFAADARVDEPLGRQLIEKAYEIGGGHNVVNVTLVDARVWDTIGEISVLLVVATGVASLIFVTRREQRIPRVRDLHSSQKIWRRRSDTTVPSNILDFDARPADEDLDGDDGASRRWREWLTAGRTLAPERRMVVLEVITRICFPLVMMFSVYTLMAGHNHPGGGFAGGLIAGLALTLRYLAGGRYELAEALPVAPGAVLGTGMGVAVLAAVMPLAFGGSIFTAATPVLDVPLLGEMHMTSALVFDVGVYLVVLGVIMDLLRSLGAQLDVHQEADADVR
jgi:multicomponent Na+:H+ antiporter subunit A